MCGGGGGGGGGGRDREDKTGRVSKLVFYAQSTSVVISGLSELVETHRTRVF